MKHNIKLIDYTNILSIWKKYLWPNRESYIESTSAMVYLNGYDLNNMSFKPSFFGYYINDNLVGVNSGHKCYDMSYRSRGLYVFPEFRKQGIGTKLLLETIDQGKKENCEFVWSYPKQTSWKTYQAAGFVLSSPWELSELGHNAYCIKQL